MINPTISFNGHDLSREIPGFCLLEISGREGQKRPVTDIAIPGRRGTQYRSAVYGAKTIKVKYVIKEIVNRKKGNHYNLLNGILAYEQGKLIFSDEPDKYWIATPSAVTADTITFYCADPCKYSTIEKPEPFHNTSLGSLKQATVTNEGTVPVPVRYEILLGSESGYVGIASDLGAMEFGNHAETDKTYDKRNESLMKWGDFTAGNDTNSHHTLQRIRQKQMAGQKQLLEWLALGYSAGIGNHPSSGWCHSWKTYSVPKTSQNSDAKDFELHGQAWFECANPGQIGEQIIECLGEKDGAECQIARLTLSKGTTDFVAHCYIHVNGSEKKHFTFAPNSQSPYANGTSGYFSITKEKNIITVKPAVESNSIRCEVAGFENIPLKKIRIYIGHMPYTNPSTVTRLYFGNLNLTANNVEGTFDARNTFFPGSDGLKLTIDGTTSKLYLDGAYRPDLEVLGTKWFMVPPGEHTISLILSDWFTGKVTAKAFIREAWL